MLSEGYNAWLILIIVIRASVPKLNLDDTFEQKNEIAKAVEDEIEKVLTMPLNYELI